jgi:hypothetical protein
MVAKITNNGTQAHQGAFYRHSPRIPFINFSANVCGLLFIIRVVARRKSSSESSILITTKGEPLEHSGIIIQLAIHFDPFTKERSIYINTVSPTQKQFKTPSLLADCADKTGGG